MTNTKLTEENITLKKCYTHKAKENTLQSIDIAILIILTPPVPYDTSWANAEGIPSVCYLGLIGLLFHKKKPCVLLSHWSILPLQRES